MPRKEAEEQTCLCRLPLLGPTHVFRFGVFRGKGREGEEEVRDFMYPRVKHNLGGEQKRTHRLDIRRILAT